MLPSSLIALRSSARASIFLAALLGSGCGGDDTASPGGASGATSSASQSAAESGSTATASSSSASSGGGGGGATAVSSSSVTGGGGAGGTGSGGLDCGIDPFHCDDGTCLPETYECDMVVDCDDASDEAPANHRCPIVPDAWSCDPFFYDAGDDDSCDCGCGAVDPDCDDETAASCEICDAEGSCDLERGTGDCGTIDPDDNASCE